MQEENLSPNFLNAKRLSYAYWMGGALWAVWILSLCLGSNGRDYFGNVMGADYIQFYAAAKSLVVNHASKLYDFEFQKLIQEKVLGSSYPQKYGVHLFLNPPLLAYVYLPFSKVPYGESFFLWTLFSFLCFGCGLSFLGSGWRKSWGGIFSWFPVFASFSFGQNSALTFYIFCAIYKATRSHQNIMAGFLASLLFYKPYLMAGPALLWIFQGRPGLKSFLVLFAGAALWGALSYIWIPDAMASYESLVQHYLGTMHRSLSFARWHLFTVQSFFDLLLPYPSGAMAARILGIGTSLVGLWRVIDILNQTRENSDLQYAWMVAGTVWMAPHLMIYDAILLLIPAILFWEAMPSKQKILIRLYAWMWIATALAAPLCLLQLRFFPWTIHFGVLIWIGVFFWMTFNFNDKTAWCSIQKAG